MQQPSPRYLVACVLSSCWASTGDAHAYTQLLAFEPQCSFPGQLTTLPLQDSNAWEPPPGAGARVLLLAGAQDRLVPQDNQHWLLKLLPGAGLPCSDVILVHTCNPGRAPEAQHSACMCQDEPPFYPCCTCHMVRVLHLPHAAPAARCACCRRLPRLVPRGRAWLLLAVP